MSEPRELSGRAILARIQSFEERWGMTIDEHRRRQRQRVIAHMAAWWAQRLDYLIASGDAGLLTHEPTDPRNLPVRARYRTASDYLWRYRWREDIMFGLDFASGTDLSCVTIARVAGGHMTLVQVFGDGREKPLDTDAMVRKIVAEYQRTQGAEGERTLVLRPRSSGKTFRMREFLDKGITIKPALSRAALVALKPVKHPDRPDSEGWRGRGNRRMRRT